MSAKRPIFAFLRSRGARLECPFCGGRDWEGWDERVSLDHVRGSSAVNRRAQAFPLMCRNCGFIRLQATHVLDDPRAPYRNVLDEDHPVGAPPVDGEGEGDVDALPPPAR